MTSTTWIVGVIAGSLALSACSGGGGDSVASTTDAIPATTASTVQVDESAPEPGDDAPPTTSTQPATTTTVPATTTTLPPPEVAPVGAHWPQPALVAASPRSIGVRTVVQIDDEIWVLAHMLNGGLAFRSTDAGVTWQQVDITPPPADASISFTDIDRSADGRYLITASLGSRCELYDQVEGGYRIVGLCLRHRPVVFVSDDAVSWRRIDPPAMAPPGDVSVSADATTAWNGGFVTVGTLKSTDWHLRVWTSPDGETWSLDREIRGASGPISATDVVAGDDAFAVLAAEHPCSTPTIGSPGWFLGSTWGRHARIFDGASAAELVLRTEADHPFVVPPAEVDCDAMTSFDIADLPYPSMRVAEIGGDVVVLELPIPVDDDEATITRRLATLSDGTWEVVEIEDVPAYSLNLRPGLIDVDGEPGIVGLIGGRARLSHFVSTLPDGAGDWTTVESEPGTLTSSIAGGVWADGGLVLVGTLRDDPFATTIPADAPVDIVAWRSVETSDTAFECSLVPGGVCSFVDLSTVEGYPDFSDTDLTGIDLSYSDLGEAIFDGADLSGATLWAVEGDDASFVGATFDQARAQEADLGDATGASFIGADLSNADITVGESADFTGSVLKQASVEVAAGAVFNAADLTHSELEGPLGASFDGALLSSTTLAYTTRPPEPIGGLPGATIRWRPDDDATEPFELGLAGADLTEMTIHGGHGDVRLVITDLTGAVLTDAEFYNVDLSAIDPATIDLSTVVVWDNSLCPDGAPPDDGPIGTCHRT